MSQRELIQRGKKHSSPVGTSIFVALRSLDPFIQYGILADGIGATLLGKVGLQALPDGPPFQTGIGFIDVLQLSPYRLLLFIMSTGSVLKHIFWVLYTSKEAFSVGTALNVGIGNTVFNTLVTIIATTSFAGSLQVSKTIAQPTVIIGSILYFVGISVEVLSELQRKFFKDDPKNDGKAFTRGLWSLARHINYTGYLSWRVGYSLAGGGVTAAFITGAFLLKEFLGRAIPELDAYASKRYREQWDNYKRRTPYKLIPGIL
ncbi:hypothetical protein CPB83DRAFT_860077 [Crepidotus variabilis]|uniref:Steroid 5-alpha reductase C-terminal domain-containing protein n=1 Tax=Crepidotus variabilis TaxID=179855 RepID=A0A9P6E9X6_9AGAR|nr:hypothetical protein CPB83DRAFT_860077 [Crepidotus variabilis]